jgi:hypothetical protein
MVTVSRKTIDELFGLIGECVDTITDLQPCEIFITSAKRCLLDTANIELASSVEVSQVVLLMDSWLKVVPKHYEEMARWLQQANAITYLALAPIKLDKCND